METVNTLLANPWTFVAVGYMLTVVIEIPILCLSLSREHPISRRIQAGAWLTACTYLLVVLVLPPLIDDFWAYLAVAEALAAIAECVLFWAAFAPLQPMRDIVAIVFANLTSFGFGIMLFNWLELIG